MDSRFSVYFRVALLCILLSSIVSYGEERRTVIIGYDEICHPLDKEQYGKFRRASKKRQEATLEYLVAEAQKAYMACENYEQLHEVSYKLRAIKSLCEAAKADIFKLKYEHDILVLENKVLRSVPIGPDGLIPHEYPSSELSVFGQELD